MSNNILAIIPARGGSKRLLGKNIKELDGRPLIAYSVLAALSTTSINSILLASDSEDILNAGYDSSVYTMMLPAHLTGEADTLSGTLQWILSNDICDFSFGSDGWIVLLQPTCPLRQPSLIERWIYQVLNTPNCDGGLTVDKGGYKLGFCSNDGWFAPEYIPMTPKAEANKRKGRENGVFYMFRAENILKGKPWGKYSKMIPLECPPDQSLANVDTQLDWDIMEFLYYQGNYDIMFKELEKNNG